MKKTIIFAFLAAFSFITAPYFLPTYWLMILSEILIMGLFALSFNLLLGYTGLLSFGHGAFFGVGAYTAALLLKYNFQNILLIFSAGILMAMLASSIVAYFSVKMDEIFFAMITLGFGMLFYTIGHNWTGVTGGSDGLPIFNLPFLNVFGLNLDFYTPKSMYFLIIICFFIGVSLLWSVINSPFGLMLKSLRENKNRVMFIGGDVKKMRGFAFILSGAVAGMAGVLFGLFNNMATPEFMHWSFSARPVIMAILGGSGTFLGPFVGAGIFFVLEQVVIKFTENWMFFLGLILVFIVLFFPKGVLGTILVYIRKDKKI